MGEDLSQAYKIAASACILVFILTIGLSLMMLGRNLWNQTATAVTQPVLSMQDNDAFYLASYSKPVPVAAIWKLTNRINTEASDTAPNGNFTQFAVKEQNPSNPNDWRLLSDQVDSLARYMERKAYLSWEIDQRTGLYSMEVLLVS